MKINTNISVNVPDVLYGCETWSVTLREDRGLGCSRIRSWGRYFGLRAEEVRVDWRKVHNEEQHNLCSSPGTVWVIVRNKDSESGSCCWQWMHVKLPVSRNVTWVSVHPQSLHSDVTGAESLCGVASMGSSAWKALWDISFQIFCFSFQ